jgi:hypothetical protein
MTPTSKATLAFTERDEENHIIEPDEQFETRENQGENE